MNKLNLIKGIANIATGAGVGKTVDLILKNNLPVEMNWKTRLATIIGSAAISGYISAKCSEHVESEIDKVIEMVEDIKKALPENQDVVVPDGNDIVDISVEMTD